MKKHTAIVALALVSIGQAMAAEPGPLQTAFSGIKPIFDARLRTEDVDQEGIANDANAITLRAHLGFETGKAWNTSLLVEGEAVVPIENEYRPDPLIPEKVTWSSARATRTVSVLTPAPERRRTPVGTGARHRPARPGRPRAAGV